MFQKRPSQSQSITGNQIIGSQVQVSQSEGDLLQNQQGSQTVEYQTSFSAVEVLDLLAKVEALVRKADLPEIEKGKALAHLAVTKEDIQQGEPDKESAAKNLKRMCDSIKTTNETMNAGKSLWANLQSMLIPVAGWLGVAKGFFGF